MQRTPRASSNSVAKVITIALALFLSACAATPFTASEDAPNEVQSLASTQPSLDNHSAADTNTADKALNKALTDSKAMRTPSHSDSAQDADTNVNQVPPEPELEHDAYTTLSIKRAGSTGKLTNAQLNEVSGLTASMRYPGLLYAINDSGNRPSLFAIDQTGRLIEQWDINANNRDWEDMTRLSVAGETYLVIGDTGDNLRTRRRVELLLIREPVLSSSGSESSDSKNLDPAYSIRFSYEDGPRNVEAFTAIDNTLYLLSKEPVQADGRTPSGIYSLDLPKSFATDENRTTVRTAKRVGTMPLRSAGLEATLAATFAGVDLSHPTAMEFDASTNKLYILTYREVLLVQRRDKESWAEALSRKAELVLSHSLQQAEALTVTPGQGIWFTSENTGAPLWAIPLDAPL